jgi:hypothetical protein
LKKMKHPLWEFKADDLTTGDYDLRRKLSRMYFKFDGRGLDSKLWIDLKSNFLDYRV